MRAVIGRRGFLGRSLHFGQIVREQAVSGSRLGGERREKNLVVAGTRDGYVEDVGLAERGDGFLERAPSGSSARLASKRMCLSV